MSLEHYVYRCFDADGELLYIGCTQYPDRRLTQEHPKRSPWWARCDTYTFEGPYGYFEGFDVERAAIIAELPLFNVKDNPRHAGPPEPDDPTPDTAYFRKQESLRQLRASA